MKSAQEQAREIIESIERARSYSGMRQEELAARAGITGSNYSGFKNGRHMPTLWTAISCANAVGLKLVLVPAIREVAHHDK